MDTVNFKVSAIAAPLRQQVAENIRVAILSAHFKPGERLIERELCEMTGVSRTAVREAVRQLESEGLIENIPHRGPIVARVTATDAAGIYEVRGALEGLIVRLFAERATDQQFRKLVTIFDRLKKAYETGDVAKILKVKTEFYVKLAEGAANAVAESMLRTIHTRANFLRSITLSQPERQRASIREIEVVLAKIEARDLIGAENAMRAHIKGAADAALAVIKHMEPA